MHKKKQQQKGKRLKREGERWEGCPAFDHWWRESIWRASATGCVLQQPTERREKWRISGDDGGTDSIGTVAAPAQRGISGDGEHRRLLDPPFEVLEAQGLEILLVDTRQLARVPGRDRKSDPTDCEWIQRLHSCGLLNGSFRPPEAICILPRWCGTRRIWWPSVATGYGECKRV